MDESKGEALVSGEAILSIFEGLPNTMQEMTGMLLHKHCLVNVRRGNWYKMDSFINVLNEIEGTFGEGIIYEIGKQVLNTAIMPPVSNNLKKAIPNLELGYQLNHKNVDCKVSILKYSKWKKTIVVKIVNPYPAAMNRGLLVSLARKYPPKSDVHADVAIDKDCQYTISW